MVPLYAECSFSPARFVRCVYTECYIHLGWMEACVRGVFFLVRVHSETCRYGG